MLNILVSIYVQSYFNKIMDFQYTWKCNCMRLVHVLKKIEINAGLILYTRYKDYEG